MDEDFKVRMCVAETYGEIGTSKPELVILLLKEMRKDKDFENWKALRDNYYRRNIIVHNNGRISEICIEKLKISPDLLNSKPIMNIDYLAEASNNLKSYMDFIFIAIKEKFKLNTSVRRFAPFPPNFDKPMVVKRGKDEIFNDD